MSTPPANAGQKQAGRFKPGQSGNPKGRKPGTRNRATLAAQALLEGEAEALTRTAVELALSGDTTALRLCLERLTPLCRERCLPALKLPTAETAEALPKLTGAILAAVTAGQITPSEGEKLAGLVAAHGKALELCDIETRLQKLEERQ